MRAIGICAAAAFLAACGDSGATSPAPSPSPGAAMSAQTPVPSKTRPFREWYATCDNGNACVAFTGGSTGWLRIGLEAGPDAAPAVTLGIWPSDEAARSNPVFLIIDDQRLAATAGPIDSGSYTSPAARTQAVLTALAGARAIQVTAGGDDTVDLPSAGASAAMLWIDERQGRLGTTTALIRRGDRPASVVPAAPALPVVTAAPAVSQTGFDAPLDPMQSDEDSTIVVPAALEAVPAVKQCREDTAFNEYLQKAVTASRLDAATELWGIPCDSGAYNATYVYFLTGPAGTNARVAAFPAFDGRDAAAAPTEAEGLVNPIYDPATRTLTAFPKARGLGDCGALQTWTWTGSGFVMSREQVMGECWGMVSDFWPTTYRTQ